ncbi:MAG TPA: hypothetical protein VFE90_16540 [Myxococcales bacterium]|jgi:hypothetical protein|nr:hypothetical protein [Myxococcales bacterium]
MRRPLAFILLVVALDAGIGLALDGLYRRTLTGERGGLTNQALSKDADVLVLGSSRAQYHFMPSVLHRRLGVRAFNAGLKGHDFLYAALLYDLWQRAHRPAKAVLLQMDMESLLEREQETAALEILAPYIGQSERVRDVLYAAGPFKRVEYLSKSYRYNGKLLSIAKNAFVSPDPTFDGFMRGAGIMDPAGELGSARHGLLDVYAPKASEEVAVTLARQSWSALKLRQLDDLIAAAAQRGTRLFLVHSPLYGQSHAAHDIWTGRLRQLIAGKPGVELIDLCDVTTPVFARPELYLNFNHLNGPGAEIFSGLLAEELEKRLGPRPISAADRR